MLYSRTFPLGRLAILRHAQFPAIFRTLIILANGTTINEMARTLHCMPYDIYWHLCLLKRMEMIEVKAPYKRHPLHAALGRADTHHYGSTLVGRRTRPLAA